MFAILSFDLCVSTHQNQLNVNPKTPTHFNHSTRILFSKVPNHDEDGGLLELVVVVVVVVVVVFARSSADGGGTDSVLAVEREMLRREKLLFGRCSNGLSIVVGIVVVVVVVVVVALCFSLLLSTPPLPRPSKSRLLRLTVW